MVKRIPLAALAALTLAQMLPVPVRAQVGPDADVYIYGRPGPDRFEYDRRRRPPPPPPDDEWLRRPPPPPPPPYDDYDRPRRRPPPPPPPPDDDWDRPRYDRRWRSGSICVTARGDCPTRPAPYNAPCGCEIPGFGYKRGQIGG
ncbi:hypothetical protein [Methylobacterium sp. ARG-1]|uniref:hypothetical protein n=1 Tax=Methylobacterium sp. ARG-1 TaxID=1692501 RepID=UPI000680D31F|nr:hypothetical protein [Methylobacterium sp. ARG-1]KNY22046.1 hypothetical protein AKJ13_14460 [Methylobacterium sp. ARG-1]